MIEAYQHPRLAIERAPERAGIRFDEAAAAVTRRNASRVADDVRFFAVAYFGALVFFLSWLG